jgi:hypothetical protein
MITRAHLIDVLFAIVPHSLLLDIAGPAEAFRLEQLGRSGSLVGAEAILTSLEAQVEEVTVALQAMVRQTTPDDAA